MESRELLERSASKPRDFTTSNKPYNQRLGLLLWVGFGSMLDTSFSVDSLMLQN